MRVLGIAGSPRRGGNTDILLEELLKGAASKGAETKILYLDDLRITICTHCDSCYKLGKCKFPDDMQYVYMELEKADRIVLASPLQFTGVTAEMKTMIDRLQSLWVKKYILKIPPLGDTRERKGFFISVGGRKKENLFDCALEMIKTVFRIINVTYAGELLFKGVDAKGAIKKEPGALEQAYLAGQKLVET